ncbi:hypothetical protein [Corynebacterium humireducens]|nr:hypothetical protein [Corynebacterium humireducens]
MPLMHRSIYHSSNGSALLDATNEVFLEWLESRGRNDDPVDIDLIGREGDYVEVGAGHRARIDSVGNGDSPAVRYSQMVISENGAYSTHMTAVMEGSGAWVQFDVHAPHQNSNFHAPKIPTLLLEKAEKEGFSLTSGNGSERFTPAPRRVRADEVGWLLDEVINNKTRQTTALVAGMRTDDNYLRWSETFEKWFSFSKGVATLWLLDGEATVEFNSLVHSGYAVYSRAVHSFEPLADTNDPDDAYRHRWFSSHDLFENRDSKRNQSRLYHLSRRTALKQKSPEAVVRAEKLLNSRATQLQVHRGSEDSPFRDRIRDLRTTWPTIPAVPSTKDTPAPATESEKKTTEPTAPIQRHTPVLPIRPRPTPPVRPRPAVEPKITKKSDAVPEKVEAREEGILATIREFCETIGLTPSDDQPADDLLLEVFDRVWKSERAVQNAERIIAEKDDEIVQLEADNQILQEAWDEAVAETGNLDLTIAESQRRIQHYSLQLQVLQAPQSAYEPPTVDLPKSMSKVLERLNRKKLQHVVFTGNAKKARDLDNRPNAEAIARVCWDFLITLDDYAKQCRDGHTSVEKYITESETLAHPSKFARSESKIVRTTDQYKQARSFKVPSEIDQSERIHMWAHYRLAQDGGKAPRLHYYDATQKNGKIYVGYIGEHLPSPMTT